MLKPYLRDRVLGMFLGAAAGDALGKDVEGLTHEHILDLFGPSGVTSLSPRAQGPLFSRRGLAPGDTTDVTDLFRGVALSLVRRSVFDLEDQASELVMRFDGSPLRHGKSTRRSAMQIALFLNGRPHGRRPGIPADPPLYDGDGCGNGVAMKIAPLAAWCYALSEPVSMSPFIDWAMDLAMLTHGDPRACYAAAALGGAVTCVLHLPEGFLTGKKDCRRIEPSLIQRIVPRMAHGYAADAEKRWRYFRRNGRDFASLLDTATLFLSDADKLRQVVGTSSSALESVPFAIATYLRHPYSFRKAVLEAVNAGGETDTIGSMVGSLVGATIGLDAIPTEFVRGLTQYHEILADANAFCDALDARG
jgi:ADP-ribosylglycohydrolase